IGRMIGSWADGRTIVTLRSGDEFPHPMISFWELAEGALEARGSHSADANVDSLATGDFDGDHVIDVAYTTFGEGGGIQIVTQRGEQPLRVTDPRQIVAADVDGDGRLDLVTLDFDIHDPQLKGAAPRREGAFLSVFLGNGDGSFHRELRTRLRAEPGEPWALAAGDVDGDGKLDLIVSFRSRSEPAAPGQTVGALVNLGQGRFAEPVTAFLGTEPEAVTAADLDGDGRADIVTANVLDSVSVVLSQADGAHTKLGAPTTIRLPGEVHNVAVADLDDDGCPDLAIPDAHDRTHQVHIYTGDCHGGFVRAKSFKVAGDAYGVTASDLNGDGQPDLVVTTPVGVTVLVNTSRPRGSR
ncbi:MAG TPA: VCBS repeat-containing protein, partial [Kofleriaceae bacterium]